MLRKPCPFLLVTDNTFIKRRFLVYPSELKSVSFTMVAFTRSQRARYMNLHAKARKSQRAVTQINLMHERIKSIAKRLCRAYQQPHGLDYIDVNRIEWELHLRADILQLYILYAARKTEEVYRCIMETNETTSVQFIQNAD